MSEWPVRQRVPRFVATVRGAQLLMHDPITDHCVLLTGAGGSIGSALAKEIVKRRPQSLILLDQSENNLHQIDFDLSALSGGDVCVPILGDFGDSALLAEIFGEHAPDLVIHAAAFKHVSFMERNPIPAVQNNAIGTNLLAETAQKSGATGFVMVSTDKAVNPRSVMGASKRVAELALLRWTEPRSPMRAVRLGNVLGSAGSVVPIFQRQISAGGPVTVTHPDANRYFVTIDDAVERVLLAASRDRETGVFMYDPGEPVRILDLARQLIEEAGFKPQIDIPIAIIGLRPGEKMSEEFVSGRESVHASACAKLHWIETPQPPREEFDAAIARLKECADRRDVSGLLEQLCRLVPEYQPSEMVLESARAAQAAAS
jgi:FlaA1/EpsC-like NDP-sugar epimerase